MAARNTGSHATTPRNGRPAGGGYVYGAARARRQARDAALAEAKRLIESGHGYREVSGRWHPLAACGPLCEAHKAVRHG